MVNYRIFVDMEKKCSKCGIKGVLDDFHKKRDSKDGYKTSCKICEIERGKIYRKNNLEKENNRSKKYYKENSKNKKEYSKKYYENNKKTKLAKQKERYELNPEKIKEINDKWRNANIEKDKEIKKKWRKENPEKVNNYVKKWREDNPIIVAWRNLLLSSLKRLNKKKEGHTIDLLGYSALDLKNHIQSLFTEGMSWDNHGEWHIDHIKGIINFNNETHPSIVNALSNLRPLWATTREINGVIYEGNLNRPKF